MNSAPNKEYLNLRIDLLASDCSSEKLPSELNHFGICLHLLSPVLATGLIRMLCQGFLLITECD